MRERISDRNILPVFDLEAEYQKIHSLCFDTRAFGTYTAGGISKTRPNISYNEALQDFFLSWSLRGSFTSIEEMLVELSISEDDFVKNVTEDRVLDFIQFTLNAVYYINTVAESEKYMIYKASDSIGKAIFQNCHYVADRLGTDIKKEKNEFFLVYKDDVASAIGNQMPELVESLTEYQKIDNRGNVIRKAEILCTLAKRLEPHEKSLCSTEFKALCDDTTFLLNKAARHSLKESIPIEKIFLDMNKSEIEKWCDKTYKMFLGCMAVLPYIKYKSEIKEIKSACLST